MTLDLSIIIPYYGNHPYLERALQSVRDLVGCSFEVILIDDGGDVRPERLWFQGLNHKIIMTAGRQGPAAARNMGIQEASGRYTAFLDSDDYFVKDPAVLIQNAAPEDDLLLGELDDAPLPTALKDNIGELHDPKYAPLFTKLNHFYALLYRTEYLTSEGIKFPEHIWIGEDTCFLGEAVIRAKSVLVTTHGFYHYFRGRDSSLMGSRNHEQDVENFLSIMEYLSAFCFEFGVMGKLLFLRVMIFKLNEVLVGAGENRPLKEVQIIKSFECIWDEIGSCADIGRINHYYRIKAPRLVLDYLLSIENLRIKTA